MGILFLASVLSWVMIVQRGLYLQAAEGNFRQFEETFWSGIDLNHLYLEISEKHNEGSYRTGIENIFCAGFSEFNRLVRVQKPDPDAIMDQNRKESKKSALEYMDLKPGTKIKDIKLDVIFIGSCTNGRIEDLREVAKVVEGQHVNENLNAIIVPGSGLVKEQAISEGLDKIFMAAGFEWREPGCSMCLAMNPDKLAPGQRCASTSNRNFEGRQGFRGRTHLVSPAMAAAAAIAGRFVDIREFAK